MKEVQNIPILRFPEFEQQWEKFYLKDVLIKYRLGGNYSNTNKITSNPLIKMGNIGRGNIMTDRLEYIDENETINKLDLIKYGDLFFNTRNTLALVGKVAIWKNELPRAFYNSNLMFLKFQNNFFMNYRLNSYEGIKGLRRLATGTTSVAAIYTKDLLLLKLCLPSPQEQQKIASFLTKVDDKIQQLTKKKNLLEQYKRGVMQKIFQQEVRFKYDDGKEFPEWEKKKLKEVVCERNIKAPKSDSYPLMSFVAYKGVTSKGERYNREFLVNDEDNKKYKQTEYGDFIYSSNNLETGSIGLNRYGSASISPVYSIFEVGDLCNYQFIGSYFLRKSFINKMIRFRQGVVYGQWRIHESDFLEIKEKFPSIEEQQKIANFLSAMDAKIEQVNIQLKKTKAFKKGLLQQMFV